MPAARKAAADSAAAMRSRSLCAWQVAARPRSLWVAALAVNNHRDIAHDRLVGRRTFAVVAGERSSAGLYAALLLGPFLMGPLMTLWADSASLLLPLGCS